MAVRMPSPSELTSLAPPDDALSYFLNVNDTVPLSWSAFLVMKTSERLALYSSLSLSPEIRNTLENCLLHDQRKLTVRRCVWESQIEFALVGATPYQENDSDSSSSKNSEDTLSGNDDDDDDLTGLSLKPMKTTSHNAHRDPNDNMDKSKPKQFHYYRADPTFLLPFSDHNRDGLFPSVVYYAEDEGIETIRGRIAQQLDIDDVSRIQLWKYPYMIESAMDVASRVEFPSETGFVVADVLPICDEGSGPVKPADTFFFVRRLDGGCLEFAGIAHSGDELREMIAKSAEASNSKEWEWSIAVRRSCKLITVPSVTICGSDVIIYRDTNGALDEIDRCLGVDPVTFPTAPIAPVPQPVASIQSTTQSRSSSFPTNVTEVKPVGIFKRGNLCYLLSIIQVLFHIPYFRNLIYQINAEATGQKDRVLALQHLFGALQLRRKYITTDTLTDALNWSVTDLTYQHDALEFLEKLFELLEDKVFSTLEISKEMSDVVDELETSLGENRTAPEQQKNNVNGIRKLFNVESSNVHRCPEENYKNVKPPTNDLYINLLLLGTASLDQSLKQFCEEGVIEGCTIEKPDGATVKGATVLTKTQFTSLPPVLLFHPNRVSWENDQQLLSHRWEFPIHLNMAPYVLSDDDETNSQMQREGSLCHGERDEGRFGKYEYELRSVVMHRGTSPRHGHYVACIRNSESQWICCDDDSVRFMSESEVMGQAYGGLDYWMRPKDSRAKLLVYVRKSAASQLLLERPLPANIIPPEVFKEHKLTYYLAGEGFITAFSNHEDSKLPKKSLTYRESDDLAAVKGRLASDLNVPQDCIQIWHYNYNLSWESDKASIVAYTIPVAGYTVVDVLPQPVSDVPGVNNGLYFVRKWHQDHFEFVGVAHSVTDIKEMVAKCAVEAGVESSQLRVLARWNETLYEATVLEKLLNGADLVIADTSSSIQDINGAFAACPIDVNFTAVDPHDCSKSFGESVVITLDENDPHDTVIEKLKAALLLCKETLPRYVQDMLSSDRKIGLHAHFFDTDGPNRSLLGVPRYDCFRSTYVIERGSVASMITVSHVKIAFLYYEFLPVTMQPRNYWHNYLQFIVSFGFHAKAFAYLKGYAAKNVLEICDEIKSQLVEEFPHIADIPSSEMRIVTLNYYQRICSVFQGSEFIKDSYYGLVVDILAKDPGCGKAVSEDSLDEEIDKSAAKPLVSSPTTKRIDVEFVLISREEAVLEPPTNIVVNLSDQITAAYLANRIVEKLEIYDPQEERQMIQLGRVYVKLTSTTQRLLTEADVLTPAEVDRLEVVYFDYAPAQMKGGSEPKQQQREVGIRIN